MSLALHQMNISSLNVSVVIVESFFFLSQRPSKRNEVPPVCIGSVETK